MEERNLEKALELAAALIKGEQVGASVGNIALYEEYSSNSQVYDALRLILKKLGLELYEYNNALFVSADEDSRDGSGFGFTNEELRRALGVKVNKELFLCYLIIYCTMTEFYKTSGSYTYTEFVRHEEVINAVNGVLANVVDHSAGLVLDEVEENSFKTLALLWDELPVTSTDDVQGQRAARNSRTGYVKLTFNFLVSQGLFVENQDKYYPTDRFKAMAENYYSVNRARLYEILTQADGQEETQNAAD